MNVTKCKASPSPKSPSQTPFSARVRVVFQSIPTIFLRFLSQMNNPGNVAHSFGIGLSKDEPGADGDVFGPLDESELDDGSFPGFEHLGGVDPFYDDCLANIPDVDGRLEVLPDSVRMKQDVNVRFEAEACAGLRRGCRGRRR